MNPTHRLLLGVLLPLGCTPTPTEYRQSESRPPNIVLIMADDVGWECFGSYGGEDYATPRIDALAAEGIRFEHGYSMPLCTPTRVKLMTGKYGFRNYTHFGYLSPEERTFAHMLRDAGYATAIAGKWQLNGRHNELEGHLDPERPRHAGFDESLLWQVTEIGERYWNPDLERNAQRVPKSGTRGRYGPDLFTDFIRDFMGRHRERPFFVYYPMVLPHAPFVPTPSSLDPGGAGDSRNVSPKDRAGKQANFVAMVEYIDRLVGRIVDEVDALGLSEDTLVLFTSDNGTGRAIRSRWNGIEVRGGKAGMTDTGTRVPLVARWKGHTPAGTISEDLVDFTDFYATFAEAAGVELGPADPVDGRSFFPQLQGRSGDPREWVLCHYQSYWNKEPGQFARDQRYKLYRDGRLYDVEQDLHEEHDLSGLASDAARAARSKLQAVLDQCPPFRPGKLGKHTRERPVFPDVPRLK